MYSHIILNLSKKHSTLKSLEAFKSQGCARRSYQQRSERIETEPHQTTFMWPSISPDPPKHTETITPIVPRSKQNKPRPLRIGRTADYPPLVVC